MHEHDPAIATELLELGTCSRCGDQLGRVLRTGRRSSEDRNREVLCGRCLQDVAEVCIGCGGPAPCRDPYCGA